MRPHPELGERAYIMSDGLVCKTKNDRSSWYTETEGLHCTRRGTYWLEHFNGRHGAWAEYLDRVRAAIWLIQRGFKLPTDLDGLVERITGGII